MGESSYEIEQNEERSEGVISSCMASGALRLRYLSTIEDFWRTRVGLLLLLLIPSVALVTSPPPPSPPVTPMPTASSSAAADDDDGVLKQSTKVLLKTIPSNITDKNGNTKEINIPFCN